MKLDTKWIRPEKEWGNPIYLKDFSVKGRVLSAKLTITAVGVYEAVLNGQRVGDYVLAPGYTSYWNRMQYQEYDITHLVEEENHLEVLVCAGWWRSRYTVMPLRDRPAALTAEIDITYQDGTTETISTDNSWKTLESGVVVTDIYDGEVYDAARDVYSALPEGVLPYEGPNARLVPQEGELIKEQEHIAAAQIIKTPKGEYVVDFGQNLTGYVQIVLNAKKGEKLRITHGEVLDRDGNFYNANYRSAKVEYTHICREGENICKPKGTFYGFRYIRLDEYPGGAHTASPENFEAIAVYSDIRPTIKFSCSDPVLNRFHHNVLWGQKGNFLDIPTDCPQRDERRGWSGDAQIFIKTACYNYDVEKFFTKWLRDMMIEQRQGGIVDWIIPTCDNLPEDAANASAAWGDVGTVAPWQLYMSFGNKELLAEHFPMMMKWVDYITSATKDPFLWTGGTHFGDWLGLDAPDGSYKGSTRDDFIASAYYAYSTSLVVKAGKALGGDVEKYEELYRNIVKKFRETFSDYRTQTECVLAIYFDLAEDISATCELLAKKVIECGRHLETGFVGTGYLLHALSKGGRDDLAYDLLLRREYPSWLYAPTHGGTTVWEHWDSVKEDGTFWSTDMNSFNHYAYGAVCDWIYEVAAGIKPVESEPGFKKVRICPTPTPRLEWLDVEYESREGIIRTAWRKQDGFWRYEIQTPTAAEIVIKGKTYTVAPGKYTYFSKL